MKKIILLLAISTLNSYSMQSATQTAAIKAKLLYHDPIGKSSSVAFLDNNHVAISSSDNAITIVNPETETQPLVISNADTVNALASAKPNILYVVSKKYMFPLFYDYNTGRSLAGQPLGTGQVRNDNGHTQKITSLVVINPESMATASKDGSVITLYKAGYFRKIQLPQAIKALASVNPECLLAIPSKESLLYVLNPAMQRYETIKLPEGFIKPKSLAVITPTRWALGFKDGRILILDKTNGSYKTDIITVDNKPIRTLAALNNCYLATGLRDGHIKILNSSNGSTIVTLKADSDALLHAMHAKIDPLSNAIHIVSSFNNGKTFLWKFNIAELPDNNKA